MLNPSDCSFKGPKESLHCSEDRQAFKDRVAGWSPDLIDAVDFY
jgi:hypothetical protein